jgi:hypothetical protein
MAYQRSKAWLSLRVPLEYGFEATVDLGDEKMFDFRNLPPWAKLPVRPDSEARGPASARSFSSGARNSVE